MKRFEKNRKTILFLCYLPMILFIGLLLYRLKHGRKAVWLGAAHSGGCGRMSRDGL